MLFFLFLLFRLTCILKWFENVKKAFSVSNSKTFFALTWESAFKLRWAASGPGQAVIIFVKNFNWIALHKNWIPRISCKRSGSKRSANRLREAIIKYITKSANFNENNNVTNDKINEMEVFEYQCTNPSNFYRLIFKYSLHLIIRQLAG